MPDKMDRFTQRARRVLSLAQEEAERLQHNGIGTEHLLLGLIREQDGVANKVLRELGLDYRRAEELVQQMTSASISQPSSSIDLTADTKRVLELAVDEAHVQGQHFIGTEHLLLGLVRLPDGIHADALNRMGVSADKVRQQTVQMLQTDADEARNTTEIRFRLMFLQQFLMTLGKLPDATSKKEIRDIIEQVFYNVASALPDLSLTERQRLLNALLDPFKPVDGENPPEP